MAAAARASLQAAVEARDSLALEAALAQMHQLDLTDDAAVPAAIGLLQELQRPLPPPPLPPPAATAPPPSLPRARTFTYAELATATSDFATRLGGGGFGEVYRGALPSGTPVAVKVLTQDLALGDAAGLLSAGQLMTEVRVLSEVSHPNVVPLLGSALDAPQPCLVYAFMEDGALDERLARSGGRRALTASERVLILSDAARGLAHLHTHAKIIHRDVKTANLLLDRGLVGRIGDFGLARTANEGGAGGVTVTHIQTERVIGTLIYMAPEYKNGELSTKVDAFAFGLVILEALTGLPVAAPTPGHHTLLSLFEEDLEQPAQLVQCLDRHAPGGWGEHVPAHVPALHKMATACLEPRRRRRAEVADLISQLEEMRTATLALRPAVPSQFLCPITQNIMEDPVTTADGHAYERTAIARWLSSGNTSPASGARLPHKELAPALALRQLIHEFVEANPGA